MDVKPIQTEEDYRAALREIESLMRAEPESSEGERLDALVTLVEAYERQHFPRLAVKDLIRQLAARAPAEDFTDAEIDREVQAVRDTARSV